MTSNNLVICSECGRQYNAAVLKKCPRCASLAITERASIGAGNTKSSSVAERMALQAETLKKRDALNRDLGPAKVGEYAKRLKREIEEIEYQIWRNLQPEWIESVEKYSKLDNSSKAMSTPSSNHHQAIHPLMGATAMTAVNSAFMRKGINELNNHFSENAEDSKADTMDSEIFGDF